MATVYMLVIFSSVQPKILKREIGLIQDWMHLSVCKKRKSENEKESERERKKIMSEGRDAHGNTMVKKIYCEVYAG